MQRTPVILLAWGLLLGSGVRALLLSSVLLFCSLVFAPPPVQASASPALVAGRLRFSRRRLAARGGQQHDERRIGPETHSRVRGDTRVRLAADRVRVRLPEVARLHAEPRRPPARRTRFARDQPL